MNRFYSRFLLYSWNKPEQILPPSIHVSHHFPALNLVTATMPKIGFSAHKVDVVLSAIKIFLPIGPYDWDRVAAEHDSHFPDAGRA